MFIIPTLRTLNTFGPLFTADRGEISALLREATSQDDVYMYVWQDVKDECMCKCCIVMKCSNVTCEMKKGEAETRCRY